MPVLCEGTCNMTRAAGDCTSEHKEPRRPNVVFFRQCGAEIVHVPDLVIVERSCPSAAISEVEDGGA